MTISPQVAVICLFRMASFSYDDLFFFCKYHKFLRWLLSVFASIIRIIQSKSNKQTNKQTNEKSLKLHTHNSHLPSILLHHRYEPTIQKCIPEHVG